MADVRSVLDHLLEGRTVLVAEVDRLSAAIADLDAVIGRLGGAGAAPAPVAAVPPSPRAEPVTALRGATRRAPAARKSVARPAAPAGEGGKSIRVHVLEMLESEQREMGLAEIIDRVHAAGIQAHDDAVRSITIKLMKDGKVERVGRGQYRLAGGAGSEAGADTPEPIVDESTAGDGPPIDGSAAESVDGSPTEPPVAAPVTTPAGPEPGAAGYTPPLNLGQPWQQR